ncbi:response regulator [Geodermatophilus obscurus]|uniref:Two component transcriptional regulator, LuxR family n=1 Tax=Geodermatophilus obscurus (strain ATCC 25078 / DSM 43160 / JCM 3152 / CCUG 61914 / KCC A-0152 / KCTC 9177 / NBRC 13315 / NRRL B-3577 / G-20) TaxID=526225 RepID=D2SFS4_GEOOG|nr:response regulator transcription factor [Geodermatophilus obscurus]ADB74829.1 two component transcriptional regulator, LuxR family [Geodermatophilus obscurus DSM 43160]
MIDVLVVDDHALMRTGLSGLIAAAGDMRVVGTAADGAEAVEEVARLAPHVVLMDLSMPVLDGVAATRRIVEEHPSVEVLVLTSFSDRQRVIEALDAGAGGYVLKDTEPADLLAAIRSTARGHSPLDPRVARTVLHARRSPVRAAELTEREQEVLALVGHGLANKQIARRLGIRESTVKAHLTSVFQRIGVRDRTSATLWARTHLPEESYARPPAGSRREP